MKFRQVTATIAIYFLFTLLWFTSNSFASQLENHTPNYHLLNKINKERHLFYIIFNQFLAIQDILIFRQTCRNFGSLLHPSDKKMVMFCTKFCSEEFDNVLFAWMDLKYVLDQSYYTVFESMEMFNIKEYQYAIVTRTLNKNIISWFNTQYPYPEMIFHKARKEFFAIEQAFALIQYDPPKIYNHSDNAWAQITEKGNVVTGGDEHWGGDSNNVQSQLKNVKLIVSTYYAFAALLNNGSVIAWGDEYSGGEIPDDIQPQLQHVKMIFSTKRAFAALLNNGSVIAWGHEYWAGKIPHDIQPQLQHVKMIYSSRNAFAALLANGSVFAWGHENWGGKIPHDIQFKLMENVTMIYSTDGAFAALLDDGSVFAWGDENKGGKIPEQLKNVKMIYSTAYAFAALLGDDSVFAWGDKDWGGKIPHSIQSKLIKNVVMIFSKTDRFIALCKNGEVIEW